MMNSFEKPTPLPLYQITDSGGQVMKVQIEEGEIFKDSLTGQLLPPELVRAARK